MEGPIKLKLGGLWYRQPQHKRHTYMHAHKASCGAKVDCAVLRRPLFSFLQRLRCRTDGDDRYYDE